MSLEIIVSGGTVYTRVECGAKFSCESLTEIINEIRAHVIENNKQDFLYIDLLRSDVHYVMTSNNMKLVHQWRNQYAATHGDDYAIFRRIM